MIRVYKRTPTAMLKKETNISSIDLHIERNIMQRNLNTASHSVVKKISKIITVIWTLLRQSVSETQRQCRQGTVSALRPPLAAEKTWRWVAAQIRETVQEQWQPRNSQLKSLQKALTTWMNLEWRWRWTHRAVGQSVTT